MWKRYCDFCSKETDDLSSIELEREIYDACELCFITIGRIVRERLAEDARIYYEDLERKVEERRKKHDEPV